LKNIKSNISSVLFQIGGDRYHDLIIIALSWKTVVGAFMAEHSSVLKYQNNTLYVGVDSSVWLQEFVLMKSMIIKQLNKVVAKEANSKINNLVFLLSEKKHD
jgi:predicted nucleic acid-binding Zn ribbon protein